MMSSHCNLPNIISTEHGDIFTQLKIPSSNTPSNGIVIFVPAIGTDYNNSYRSFRALRGLLAEQGIANLTMDYLNTGNSSNGINESNKINSMQHSVESVVNWAKNYYSIENIILVGFKFGATLATIVAEKLGIRNLVIWSPVLKGKNLLREIKLLESSSETNHEPSGLLEYSGLSFNEQDEEAISLLDFSQYELHKSTRVLAIIDSTSKRLVKILDQWKDDIALDYYSSKETEHLLVDAHFSKVALETNAAILHWIKDTLPQEKSTGLQIPIEGLKSELKVDFNLFETHSFSQNNYFVTVTNKEKAPSSHPRVIFLNSGSNHQVGPHRLYVTLSRSIAAQGYEVVRLDMPGLGETPAIVNETENDSYMPEPTKFLETWYKETFDDNKPIILIGLCSGAFHSFKAVAESQTMPIQGGLLINPLTFYWEEGMSIDDAPSISFGKWNWYKQSMKDWRRWKKLLSGKVALKPVFNVIKERIASEIASRKSQSTESEQQEGFIVSKNVAQSINEIAEKERFLRFIFSNNDPGLDILMSQAKKAVKASMKSQRLSINVIANADHTFSRAAARKKLDEEVLALLTEKAL